MSSNASLDRRDDWRRVSKALLKSSAVITTYGLVASRSETDCSNAMRAAVMDPVGRKAYWSAKLRAAGGERIAGYRNLWTTTRLQRTGVIEIGRKWECSVSVGHLGTGWMEARFHCRGTTDVVIDLLNKVTRDWFTEGWCFNQSINLLSTVHSKQI